MNIKYPFDSSIKHHLLIALGLAIWIFVFLYFTEPLDVSEFYEHEKLLYLPLYGSIGGISYLVFLPLQSFIHKKSNGQWLIKHELIFLISFAFLGVIFARLLYLFVVVPNEPNPYPLSYHLTGILLPALLTILPIIIFGRFAFGKYRNKKLEDQKIEIKGEGNYESIRLLINDLICVKSSDNYVEVFYLSNNTLKKSLIRNKLSVIAESFPELLRTHRSYIINPYHFEQWKTEKGKHFLLLSNAIETPISKTYLEATKRTLNIATT
ncbi:LytTR family DNA-binding domain-containing protein [Lacinutrix jangbogonensis]|uniref:LytTR family DNA-binding domain-containing protein n=1 Tax=Lacinutrix jangbogonensis TaxID=1469557 RepID=UPI00053E8A34|nr:LytTR family DNA-binding domain-containing protein [Lacinutrix jangbogonensis]